MYSMVIINTGFHGKLVIVLLKINVMILFFGIEYISFRMNF